MVRQNTGYNPYAPGQAMPAVGPAGAMPMPQPMSHPASFSAGGVPPSPEQFLAGYHAIDATPAPGAVPNLPLANGIQDSLVAASGGSALAGLAGQATQGQQPPQTWLGRLKKHFFDIQVYAFMPGFLLLPMALLGSDFNKYINREVGAQAVKGWRKPFAYLGRLITDYDKLMWKWGKGISNTVKNKWGLKLGKNNWLNKLYNRTLWKWTADPNPSKKSAWRGFLNLVGTAGQPVRAGKLATNAAGRLISKFSIRSILTGLGFTGPIGWVTLLGAAGLTLFNVIRGKHKRDKLQGSMGADAAALQQQAMLMQQQQALANPQALAGTVAGAQVQGQLANNPFAQAYGMPNMATPPTGLDYNATINSINNPTNTPLVAPTPRINGLGQPSGGAGALPVAMQGQQQSLSNIQVPGPGGSSFQQQGYTGDTTGFSAATAHLINQSNQLLAMAKQSNGVGSPLPQGAVANSPYGMYQQQ